MHTDPTLKIFEELTTVLGDKLRFFADVTCANYKTFELPREAAARKRRQSKQSQGKVSSLDENERGQPERKTKAFNMETYKHHALGDYVETIRAYGTCDSYSTEPVRVITRRHAYILGLIIHCSLPRVNSNIAQQKHGTVVPIGGSLSSRCPKLNVVNHVLVAFVLDNI